MYPDIRPDIVIVTALEKEFDALEVFSILINGFTQIGIRRYYFKDFQSTDKKSTMRIAFVRTEGEGRVNAALVARDAIYDLTPSYIILFGIAATDPQICDLAIGDVVISESITDYEIQKISPEGISWRTIDFNLHNDLVGIARYITQNRSWTTEIDSQILDLAPKQYKTTKAEIVKVACGDKVIAYSKFRDELLRELGKTRERLYAIDMESAGICHAIHQCPDDRTPKFIMIKGISDYADRYKHDRTQSFAAGVATVFLRNFLSTFLEQNRDRYLVG